MTSLVPEVVDARRIGKDVEQLAIMLSQGTSLCEAQADDSTRIPIRFFAKGCDSESKEEQATTSRLQAWITKEWSYHCPQLEFPAVYLDIISNSNDGLLEIHIRASTK